MTPKKNSEKYDVRNVWTYPRKNETWQKNDNPQKNP